MVYFIAEQFGGKKICLTRKPDPREMRRIGVWRTAPLSCAAVGYREMVREAVNPASVPDYRD